jgi:hypothetical protein
MERFSKFFLFSISTDKKHIIYYNNLVIPKKEIKNFKNFHHRFKIVIVTSKVIRRRQQRSIDRKGIIKQSESEEAPNIQEARGSNSIQVSSAILQNQVNSFMIYFTKFYLN